MQLQILSEMLVKKHIMEKRKKQNLRKCIIKQTVDFNMFATNRKLNYTMKPNYNSQLVSATKRILHRKIKSSTRHLNGLCSTKQNIIPNFASKDLRRYFAFRVAIIHGTPSDRSSPPASRRGVLQATLPSRFLIKL